MVLGVVRDQEEPDDAPQQAAGAGRVEDALDKIKYSDGYLVDAF